MMVSSQAGKFNPIPHNLPGQLTSFIGREEEIEEISTFLDRTRSLTLVGTGGVGKTRLALESLSTELEKFPDGIWFIEFGSLFESDLVVNQIYSALGLRGSSSESSLDDLSEYLAEKTTLLVFDNCEHLVLVCAHIAEHLLLSCPGFSILATSREPLGYPGETIYQVPAMKLPIIEVDPDLESVRSSEAAVLFVERIKRFQPGFQIDQANAPAVIKICNQLEGIPLALELAAARAKYLGVSQIAEKLEDSLQLLTRGSRISQPRQQTLRSTIEWSFSLLDEQEQSLFRALAVFSGEFTLEDVERVISSEPTTSAPVSFSEVGSITGLQLGDILDLLSNLVDKSLLMVRLDQVAIFRMLIPIQQFAKEKLSESGELDVLRTKHLNHYLDLAEYANFGIRGKEQSTWLDRLDIEHDNLRLALGWAFAIGSIEDGLRMTSALREFWSRRGNLTEGVRWLELFLNAEHPKNSNHANALIEAGILNYEYGNLERAKKYGETSYDLYDELSDSEGIARALFLLGVSAHFSGDRHKAIQNLEDSLLRFRELGDDWSVARTLLYLGDAYIRNENYQQAIVVVDECLTLFRQLGDAWGIAFALGTSGELARQMGDFELAKSRFNEDLTMQYEQGNKVDVCYLLESMAILAVQQEVPTRAAILWGSAGSLRESFHARIPPSYQVDIAPYIALAREQLGESAYLEAWEYGASFSLEQVIEFALRQEYDEPIDISSTTSPETESQQQQYDLTLRELDVLRLVAEGQTDSQVAEQLFISPRTVGKHLQSIYQKFHVSSRTAAARFAADHDII